MMLTPDWLFNQNVTVLHYTTDMWGQRATPSPAITTCKGRFTKRYRVVLDARGVEQASTACFDIPGNVPVGPLDKIMVEGDPKEYSVIQVTKPGFASGVPAITIVDVM
jgi:hypothetical protein